MNQMETKELLLSIQQEIAQLKLAITSLSNSNPVSDKWIPRKDVMQFFNYAPTQMASLESTPDLIIAKIGKRKFIHKGSLEKLLEKNIKTVIKSSNDK